MFSHLAYQLDDCKVLLRSVILDINGVGKRAGFKTDDAAKIQYHLQTTKDFAIN